MATARKLPSGSWRVLCFDGMANGKRHYVSITGATKKEAEFRAAQYLAGAKSKTGSLTVKEAIERYITAKTEVLSPSTIAGYRRQQKTYYGSLEHKDIYKLTSEDMQIFVSSITGSVKAKTVANVYALLSASIGMFRPDAVFRVTLPQKVRPQKQTPQDSDVRKLFEAAEGDHKTAIALAAFGSMRRGEICAMKYGDVSGNVIHIHADMVCDENNEYQYKEIPKTSDSDRYVMLPPEVIQMLGTGEPDEFIIKKTPNAITSHFTRLRNRVAPGIRFHDLRHYFASIGAALGIPDTYLSDFGGWRNGSGVMKEVYQGTMADKSAVFAGRMTEHFSDLINMQHEMQHE